jgi:NAD(P)H-hydrate epimerase
LEEASRLAARASAVAIGCGLSSEDEETRRFVRLFVERRAPKPLLLDADALNALAPWPAELSGTKEAPLILTPHEGEMRRLLASGDEVAEALERLRADRVGTARDFAVRHQLILVLKGTRTLVAAPDGRVFVIPTGNAGLGTAGSGDTLSGIIAAFNAQAFATLKDKADAPLTNDALALAATIAAVYVGGMAGDFAACERGMRAMVASDIREYLGRSFRALDAKGEQP